MKKTLYEILGVSPNAASSEIHAAHQILSRKLQLGESGMSQGDAELELKLVNMAFETLSNDQKRADYDSKLKLDSKSKLLNEPTASVSLPEHSITPPRKKYSPLSAALTVIAILTAIGLFFQLGGMLMFYGQIKQAKDGHESAEEKVLIQEYYQENGVRPGSRIEADLLAAEKQRKANEQRQQEFEEAEKERKYQRFLVESRRLGEQVTADMERAKEHARQEAELKKQQEEQENKRAN